MAEIEKFLESMQTKTGLIKQQIGEFRSLVRDEALEEAALYVEAAGGINSAAFAAALREMQS